MLKGKVYKALEIPAEKNWKTTEEKVYYTGVLTGISGAGFNTRYAVRSYMKSRRTGILWEYTCTVCLCDGTGDVEVFGSVDGPEEMACQKCVGCM